MILEHEQKYDSFTSIIIKLRPLIAGRLLRDKFYKSIEMVSELADIYYFHLHPEHVPDRIATQFKASDLKNTTSRYAFDDIVTSIINNKNMMVAVAVTETT